VDVLLGVGWNFGFIGATTMLASAHAPEERAKVQGLNDFLVFGLVTVASFSSGALMDAIVDLITEDLRQEDDLNEEVRKLLDGYGEEIRTGGVEYREMFKLVKKRLAREQGLIL